MLNICILYTLHNYCLQAFHSFHVKSDAQHKYLRDRLESSGSGQAINICLSPTVKVTLLPKHNSALCSSSLIDHDSFAWVLKWFG